MNRMNYVSQETAKLLRQKGFNEETRCYIDDDGDIFDDKCCLNQDLPEWRWSCPSLIETLDYLEKKGVHIEIRMQHCKTKGDLYQIADDDEYQWKWYYAICKGDDIKNPILEEGDDGYVLTHPDMVGCLRAAIRKGVELL